MSPPWRDRRASPITRRHLAANRRRLADGIVRGRPDHPRGPHPVRPGSLVLPRPARPGTDPPLPVNLEAARAGLWPPVPCRRPPTAQDIRHLGRRRAPNSLLRLHRRPVQRGQTERGPGDGGRVRVSALPVRTSSDTLSGLRGSPAVAQNALLQIGPLWLRLCSLGVHALWGGGGIGSRFVGAPLPTGLRAGYLFPSDKIPHSIIHRGRTDGSIRVSFKMSPIGPPVRSRVTG